MNNNILFLLDQIRAIGSEGLLYASDKYDIERYKKLIDLASKKYAEILDIPPEEISKTLKKEIGCITPKLGVDIAIVNNQREVLILKRSDDKKWGIPCGWEDVGETPFETAIREAKEEAGLDIKPLGYIAVTNKGPDLYSGITHQLNLLVAVEAIPKRIPIKLSHEHIDYQWIKKEDDNIDWHPGHKRLIKLIFQYIYNGVFIPHRQ